AAPANLRLTRCHDLLRTAGWLRFTAQKCRSSGLTLRSACRAPEPLEGSAACLPPPGIFHQPSRHATLHVDAIRSVARALGLLTHLYETCTSASGSTVRTGRRTPHQCPGGVVPTLPSAT